MPKAKDSLKIEVNETTTRELRSITVTIQAPAQEFLLADLLKQRGAVGSVDIPLKHAVKDAVQSYLETTEDLIAGLAAGQKKGGNGAKPKGKTVLEENGADTLNRNGAGHENGEESQTEMLWQSGVSDEALTLQ
jgi:hypothetical protein